MRRWCCALLCMLLAPPALGQVSTADAESELAAAERRVQDRTFSIREREAAADRAIEIRRGLISAATTADPRLPVWLAEQGAALLARLSRDGSDTAVLFALPTFSQRESVGRAAREAADLLRRAEDLAGSAGDEPRDAGNLKVRVPFFRARAEILLAALSKGAERTTHAQAAHAAVAKMGLVNPGPEAVRRVIVGTALLLRNSPALPADAQAAIEELAWAAMGGENPEQPSAEIGRATRAEAWLALLHAAAALNNVNPALERLRAAVLKDPFVVDGKADPLLVVLAADAMSRVMFERGLATQDRELLKGSVLVQASLLKRQDLGFRAEALWPAVIEKLADLSDQAPAGIELPAGMQLARAIRMARDPAQREPAIKALAQVADDPSAESFAADALWEWSVLLLQTPPDPDHRTATRLLTRLAAAAPDHPRAIEAILAALAYGRQIAAGAPGDPEAVSLYREALALATAQYPQLPEIDVWRYERGRLALQSGEEGELAKALAAMREVSPRFARSADAIALLERLQVHLIEAIGARLEAARARGAGEQVKSIAAGELEPLARKAVEWSRSAGSSLTPRFEADLADALTESGRTGGLAIYQQLIQHSAGHIPRGRPRLLLGLARSHLLAGNSAEAFSLLREVGAALDAQVPGSTQARPQDYWHAWTLLLELLHKQAQGASDRTGAIRAHLRRLESIDPELGGEPWKTRLEQIARAVNAG